MHEVRGLIRDEGRVRRKDVLPRDEERETHEVEEHGLEDGFELEPNDGRDFEKLQDGFDQLGRSGVLRDSSQTNEKGEPKDPGAVLDGLERRLHDLEERIRRRS